MENFTLIQMIGVLAAIASVVSFAPQAWKTIKTRDVDGMSGAMYALTVSAFALWLTYGILNSDWALIIPNALCLILASFILMMIIVPQTARENIADAIEPGKCGEG